MENMKCCGCGMDMKAGDAKCSKCGSGMQCDGMQCGCACGNKVMMGEVKCASCLEKGGGSCTGGKM